LAGEIAMQFFATALTGLISSQYAIDQTANNIANANTPGFHRREIQMVNRKELSTSGRFLGGGSLIDIVSMVRNKSLETSLTHATGDLASIDHRLAYEQQVEFLFSNRPGSLYERFNSLFGELGKLSTDPQQAAQRNVVLGTGEQLAGQFKQLSSQLDTLKKQARNELQQEITDLNRMISELADLQLRIQDRVNKQPPNDLIDERDRLINKIAEVVDVSRNEFVQGGFGLSLAGGSLSLGDIAPKIELKYNDDGSVQIQIGSQGRPLTPRSGRLAALLETHNTLIPEYQSRMRTLASDVIRNFNQTHAQGIGPAGPFNLLSAANRVTDPDVPLAEAGLPFDFEAGDLYITVTGPGGERRVSKISIDPATQSLNDVATALNGISNLQGVVDSQTGELRILTDPGYKFDFTGRLETVPDLTAFTGTSVPRLSGEYTGTANDELRVVVNGTGTVGLTPGLTADVFDGAGNLLKQIEVGASYEAGKAIEVYQGVKVSFGAGDVANGDQFTTPLVANSDEGQFLSAIGLNSFFWGQDPLAMEISTELKNDSARISIGKTGEYGDTTIIKKLLALREQPLGEDGLTFEQYHAETTALVGSRVRSSTYLQTQLQDLKSEYEQQREGMSGVDVNEEMVNLSKFQRAYEATVRVLTAMDQMYQELLGALR
jgi:flagellar hook-associated protein FlgK